MASAQSDFVIDQVSWHTQTQGNPESRERIEERFRVLFGFLKKHKLLAESAPSFEPLDDTTSIRASHLTPIGLEVMKKGYDKWLSSLDQGAPLENLGHLERALPK